MPLTTSQPRTLTEHVREMLGEGWRVWHSLDGAVYAIRLPWKYEIKPQDTSGWIGSLTDSSGPPAEAAKTVWMETADTFEAIVALMPHAQGEPTNPEPEPEPTRGATADQVVKALRKRPDLLTGVLTALLTDSKQLTILSPWVGRTRWRLWPLDIDLTGEHYLGDDRYAFEDVVEVFDEDAGEQVWEWCLKSEFGKLGYKTEAEAQAAADAYLREHHPDWVLL